MERLVAAHGRALATEATQAVLADLRAALAELGPGKAPAVDDATLLAAIGERLAVMTAPTLRAVFNMTGTVLHTNLGRAALPTEAIDAVVAVSRGAANLEYDLGRGQRGDRDDHLEGLLCRLTGAEAATVVNNNAAAVLLILNSLAQRREVIVSRGELIEIGGAFRLPDIMARAGCKLREVGTTNRTHPHDYADAIGRGTALLMKVHTSNYAVQGFTAAVPEAALAALAREHRLPLVVDLGSGALIDLGAHGLPREPTLAETITAGADLVSFSGDKLLGGPQAGLIVGRADLVRKLRRNPIKRALRVDKMTVAALSAVLRLHLDPDQLAEKLPTLRMLSQPAATLEALAARLQPVLTRRLAGVATVRIVACQSQIGSGARPLDHLPSVGLALDPATGGHGSGAALVSLAAAFRALPVPVIGRIEDGALLFDLRCLEDERAFLGQLDRLSRGRDAAP
jgi:L-seryl-tRNA(Ser) seleniumtransferase